MNTDDLCECEQERAAILEHDGHMTREAAERMVRATRGIQAPRCDQCPREVES